MFYTKVVEDQERTRTEGRKCFKDEEWIKIMVPGDRHNTVERPVQRTGIIPTDDCMRFARQYERFRAQQAQPAHEGTPLSLWPQIPAPLAEELRFINIFTVEQLATLADTYIHKVPMGSQWKQKASDFVKAMQDASVVNKMQAELAQRDNDIETLKQALKDQAARIEELERKRK
jgi:hypothetical protein